METINLIRDENGTIIEIQSDCKLPEIQMFLALYPKFINCFNIEINNIQSIDRKLIHDEKISFLNEKMDNIKNVVALEYKIEQEKLLSKIKVLEEKNKIKEEYFTKEREILEEQLSQYRLISEANNITKGLIGENYVYNHLLDTYFSDDYSIIKCSSKKEVGDIQFKYKDFSVCIESKNYASSVRRAQIEKFIRDVNGSRYHAGIIYNLNSTFVDKPNFHIDWTSENKPVIFISKLKETPMYIDIALKIILFILRNSGINPQKEIIDVPGIINELRLLITDNRDLQNTLNKSSDRLCKMIDRFTGYLQ